MKKLIFAICIFFAFLTQGCVAYVAPAGGYYYRERFWYYKDGRGNEHRENNRYHHPADQRQE